MVFIPKYIFILAFLICVDYFMGMFIEKAKGPRKKFFFIISILSNIGILCFYKYVDFFNSSLAQFSVFLGFNYQAQLLHLILPIGLSFHTFQSLSYIFEVYKGRQKAERKFGIYALYVMFYPQLVAGPIEKPQDMLPQLSIPREYSDSNVSIGLQRILFGLFKKMIIADRLAILVNQVYGQPHFYVGFPLILATIAFAIQIYCDFSGYSDIAIGCARVMGFTLRENFSYPYLARSIQDFWRRWHMSLYSWFQSYVYIPLGGNRRGVLIQIRNILIVFVLTGLWHGAKWTYILWGAIHGMYILTSLLVETYIYPHLKLQRNTLRSIVVTYVQTVLTFCLVCFAWIFFRSSTVSDAIYIVSHMSLGLGSLIRVLLSGDFTMFSALAFYQGPGLGLSSTQIGIAILAILIMEIYHYLQRTSMIANLHSSVRWGIYLLLALMILNLGPSDQVPFIYFQF